MSSFTTRVGEIAGSTTGYTANILSWLEDGVRFIADTVIAAKEDNVKMFTKNVGSFTNASPYVLKAG